MEVLKIFLLFCSTLFLSINFKSLTYDQIRYSKIKYYFILVPAKPQIGPGYILITRTLCSILQTLQVYETNHRPVWIGVHDTIRRVILVIFRSSLRSILNIRKSMITLTIQILLNFANEWIQKNIFKTHIRVGIFLLWATYSRTLRWHEFRLQTALKPKLWVCYWHNNSNRIFSEI